MERSQLFDLMGQLQLYGMKAAFDEIMATAIKRQHEPQRIIGDLLTAEINEKQARSIKYQLTIAKLPLAKDLDDFQFDGTPINETLVRDLAGGGFLAQQRNAVLVGGTGTGKTHVAIAIARSCIRSGARGRFYNVVDLVNRLEAEARNTRQGRLAEQAGSAEGMGGQARGGGMYDAWPQRRLWGRRGLVWRSWRKVHRWAAKPLVGGSIQGATWPPGTPLGGVHASDAARA
jgi:hypothetical protein